MAKHLAEVEDSLSRIMEASERRRCDEGRPPRSFGRRVARGFDALRWASEAAAVTFPRGNA